MTKFIYSYNKFSEGAKLLAETMGIKRIKHGNSRFRPAANKTVINWGCASMERIAELSPCRIIQHPTLVGYCSNKRKFFEVMSDGGEAVIPRMPEFTTDQTVAQAWSASGCLVVARTVLNGHSAEGLVLIEPNTPSEAFTAAPLYTKYVKKLSEWRVHIVAGNVIDVQKKMKRREFEQDERDTRIRNLANGYIFAREFDDLPDDVIEQGKRAFNCSGLDFGAVDVIYNRQQNQAYVLEINTAPGLCGTTLTKYAEALGAL